MTLPPAPFLPDGFTVRLNRLVRVRDAGRTLVGGSPTRVLYLKDAARSMIHDGTIRVAGSGTRALADRLLEAGMADPVLAALPAASDDSHVTFVIPAWGRPEALNRLLMSIGAGKNVIVVDDRSPDADAISRVAAAHGARYMLLPENVGPAGARNAGLRLVETEYVAFVDSDVVIDADTVPTLLRHFADPRVALAAPRVLGLPDAGDNWIVRYENARSSLDLGRHPSIVRQRSVVSWVPSTFVLARVDALGDGFTDAMREGEDVDLMWRLAANQWRIRYEPEAQVWHEHRATTRAWLSRKAFYGSSAHPLAVRHPHDVAPAVLAPWSVGVVAALLAQRRWSIPVAAVISIGAMVRIAAKLSNSDHPMRLSAELTASGVAAALSQTMALFVRHWWPLAAVAGIFSRRIRRAMFIAMATDAVLEYRRTRPRLDPLRYAVARRLDDLAYGAGVWFSAFKGRSPAALLPDLRRSTR